MHFLVKIKRMILQSMIFYKIKLNIEKLSGAEKNGKEKVIKLLGHIV